MCCLLDVIGFISVMPSCPSPVVPSGGLVYSYDQDDLNRTEDIEDKVSADEDSRESNSVSIKIFDTQTHLSEILFFLTPSFISTEH